MKIAELVALLRSRMVETGSLACLGCGHEHDCGTQGCAIMREAADRLERTAWISPYTKLPERFEPVIVCRESGKVEAGHRDVGDWWKVYGTRTKHIIAWMPFPAAPTQE